MKRVWFIGAAVMVAAAVFAVAAPVRATTTTTWKVTVTNLTPSGSQPMSPPLFVVHKEGAHVWQEGTIASHGAAALAEDADNGVLESALPKLHEVDAAFTGEGGPIPPGESRTFTVTTSDPFNRLSVMSMLVNTNDAFTGLDSLEPDEDGATIRTIAMDAGSESNNELAEFIPGPCCENPGERDPEGDLIRPHENISGRGDLDPAVYRWENEVAEFHIERG